MTIKVVVSGALGKMGKEVISTVNKEESLELVGVVDVKKFSEEWLETELVTGQDVELVLKEAKPHVMVDFTQPDVLLNNLTAAIKNNVAPVIGTTGITEEILKEVHSLSEYYNVGAVIAPNFSIGAVLMMHFAAKISSYMPNVEIIEMHHDKKLDAPSGTAIKTAQLIDAELKEKEIKNENSLARGEIFNGINVHSIRLPGLVAHQEVIFGGVGQTLTIRHDAINREAFMPGVVLAIKEATKIKGVIYGLDKLLGLR